jgi:transcriptional regulator with XRE-family HTH domain
MQRHLQKGWKREMEFSEKIRNARIAKSMSQKELAEITGLSLRTIQNYELGTRLPKKKETYTALADALEIREEVLLDKDASFILRANERYGSRGARQAWDMVSDLASMWAGGEMDEEDMDAIMQAMQEAYWEAKKKNRKYIPKKYRSEEDV